MFREHVKLTALQEVAEVMHYLIYSQKLPVKVTVGALGLLKKATSRSSPAASCGNTMASGDTSV